MFDKVKKMCQEGKKASSEIGELSTNEKNDLLRGINKSLERNMGKILSANERDRERAVENKMSKGLLDRLTLSEERISAMIDGVEKIIDLNDPIGQIMEGSVRPNGLIIEKERVPLGLVAIIYESRPNVTVDTAALCLKSSNALILRGGRDAFSSNKALVEAIQEALEEKGVNKNAVQLIEDEGHEGANALMEMTGLVDVLIPRGSEALIRSVVDKAKVPVIETGTGNCHIYVDKYADLDMALEICINAKTDRVGVCNAMESLLVHEDELERFLPPLKEAMDKRGVEIRADQKSRQFIDAKEATVEDYGTEYLDYIFSLKSVSSIEEAIKHINKYGTGHSEVIVTDSYENALLFQKRVDAACVYVNASSRFTDGFEFGMGAEMGISTQKTHVRGPMGLEALTSYKYLIQGQGQIR